MCPWHEILYFSPGYIVSVGHFTRLDNGQLALRWWLLGIYRVNSQVQWVKELQECTLNDTLTTTVESAFQSAHQAKDITIYSIRLTYVVSSFNVCMQMDWVSSTTLFVVTCAFGIIPRNRCKSHVMKVFPCFPLRIVWFWLLYLGLWFIFELLFVYGIR